MLDKLQAVEARYEKLMSLISDPAVQADAAAYRTHTKALSDLQETVETYRLYRGAIDEKRQAEELAGDPDMADLAREELTQLNARIAEGSPALWDHVRALIGDAVAKGHLQGSPSDS